jgi:hypothetical protein
MNLFVYPWGNQPEKYKQKFKEVAEIFHSIASDVEMVWVPNQNWGYPWGGTNYGDGYSEYYPEGTGAYREYVDWVGLNFYDKDWDENNLVTPGFFAANIKGGQTNTNFYEMFAVGKNKPMLIGEIGAFDPNKDPTAPGARNPLNETEQAEFKNEWLKQVYNASTLKEEFSGLNAIIYFHVNKTETIDTQGHNFYNIVADYRIPEFPDVYKNLISDPFFIGAIPDTIPPASVTNLRNISFSQNYINWTWTDPSDSNFSKVMIYLDGSFRTNVSKGVQYYNATSLIAGTTHTISTRTLGISGGINLKWVNRTATTNSSGEMRGDVNRNNRIDTGDATLVLRSIVGLSIPPEFPPILPRADMNCNGRTDTGDATIILRMIVGLPVPRCWE